MSIVVRLATRADAAAIAGLSRDEIERGLPWSWTENRVLAAIRNPDTNVVVVGETEAIRAFGIMAYRDETAHLILFGVSPAHRRQGLGTHVLHWLERVAVDAGIRRITVECRRDNAVARNFYAEQGYHEFEISRGYYGHGVGQTIDAIRLEKQLGTTNP
jgi:ribosomal protein S18 acetylase RimI-like enzyme